MKVVSVEQVRQVEAAADAAGVSYDVMMERAGSAVAHRVLEVAASLPEQPRVTVLVGPGNNGGDGLVAARVIAEQSDAQVRVYLLKPRDEADPHLQAVRSAGLFVANAVDDQRYRVLINMVASAHVVIDALFGVGIDLPLRDAVGKLLRAVQQALNEPPPDDLEGHLGMPASPETRMPTTRPYMIAVDCPSGLDCDTGEIDRHALRADETVTFIAAKTGLFLQPGAEAVGDIHIADLGIPSDIDGLKTETRQVADADMIRHWLPDRSVGAHKGTFGRVLIVGGSVNYTGAVGLAAESAYRIGAGLVTVGAPAPVVNALAAQLLETTWVLLPHDMGVLAEGAASMVRGDLNQYRALLFGPGVGREKTTGAMLERLLRSAEPTQTAGKRGIGFKASADDDAGEAATPAVLPPLVIDADALFLLSQIANWWTLLPQQTVLTPHPGEMGTLLNLSAQEVQARRWDLAAEKAAEWNVVLVLKGANTIIAEPGGQVVVLPFKTAALATAGTGDVLAGMITGLLAQGLPAFEAAVVGGYVHGLAGRMMGEQMGTRSPLAGDVMRFGIAQALLALDAH